MCFHENMKQPIFTSFEISLETNENNHYVTCLLSCPYYISWTPTLTLQAIQHVSNQKSRFHPHCGNIS